MYVEENEYTILLKKYKHLNNKDKAVILTAYYMLKNKLTLRETALELGISKSCVHSRMYRLRSIDIEFYENIKHLLIENKINGLSKGGKICQEILKHRNRNIPIKKYKCYKEIINDIQEEMRLKNRMFNKTKLQKPDLKRKIELLDELINENLSVNKLALRYGLDPTTFSRYFKSLEKESPENFDRYITYIGNTKYNSRFKHKKGNENYKNMSNKEYKNYIENLQQSLKNKR